MPEPLKIIGDDCRSDHCMVPQNTHSHPCCSRKPSMASEGFVEPCSGRNGGQGQILDAAQQFIMKNPSRLIGKFEFDHRMIWVKRRPVSKKTIWHQWQKRIAKSLRLPIFYPTATVGGPDSLSKESERLRIFFEKGISVPRVLACTEIYILTEDRGTQLYRYLKTLKCSVTIERLLQKAVSLIRHMHAAELCHGRPSLKDMVIPLDLAVEVLDMSGTDRDVISILDLEEDPLSVMSLPEAQARDIWLFLCSAARFCTSGDLSLLMRLFHTYQEGISADTLDALRRMVQSLRPFRRLCGGYIQSYLGRDVERAIHANHALELFFLSNT